MSFRIVVLLLVLACVLLGYTLSRTTHPEDDPCHVGTYTGVRCE